jgi:RNA polymerase sigma factor (sigma-70 family)
MDQQKFLAEGFEANRTHLKGVAYRMLGSLTEADDAVQEVWLHLGQSEASCIHNLTGWLTTIVARVCLDMLRSRKLRREDAFEAQAPELAEAPANSADPEQELLFADSVGLALLVVLDRLAPAERLAYVLHDMFDLPFDEIAPIVGRSEGAARQLASRARRRVRGAARVPNAELTCQRKVVEAFLAASRDGDFDALLAILDPEVVLRADAAAAPSGTATRVSDALVVARGALAFSGRIRYAQLALVNGAVGIVVAPRGRLFVVLGLSVKRGKLIEIDVIADPSRLRQLDLAVLS